jgi:hypothetical protein
VNLLGLVREVMGWGVDVEAEASQWWRVDDTVGGLTWFAARPLPGIGEDRALAIELRSASHELDAGGTRHLTVEVRNRSVEPASYVLYASWTGEVSEPPRPAARLSRCVSTWSMTRRASSIPWTRRPARVGSGRFCDPG